MNRKYFFPIHLNGGNRGCEGIAKGTAKILNINKEHLVGLCDDVQLDTFLGISDFITLQDKNSFRSSLLKKILNRILRLIGINSLLTSPNLAFLSQLKKDDVLISTGGDMLCYENNQVISTTNYSNSMGRKTILWGCSMGEENLTPEKEETLRKFNLIYTRDTLTYNYFKSLKLENIVCYPDPAFILNAEKIELPICFQEKEVCGLNISNFIVGTDHSLDSPMGKEIIDLVNHILNKTDYNVLLIPHVFWPSQDDRLLSNLILKKFKEFKNRIDILNSINLNYLQIRYVISQCSLFIGARTHAMISAYASYVPALSLGYSIKSMGIAKDLGLPEELVFNVKHFKEGDLINSFNYLDSNKTYIQEHLRKILPDYLKNTYKIREDLKRLNLI